SEQRDRLSGWGFLGMLSGFSSNVDYTTNEAAFSASGAFEAYRVMSHPSVGSTAQAATARK
ncbi:MAG: hypothetical protein ABEH81_15390, partial [Halopenitus sp.]